jgi:hypothetical protein
MLQCFCLIVFFYTYFRRNIKISFNLHPCTVLFKANFYKSISNNDLNILIQDHHKGGDLLTVRCVVFFFLSF